MIQKYFYFFILFSLHAIVIGQTKVSGTIIDDNNLPLPGASVFEKGTTNGTATNFDGEYTITVSDPNATLIYSFLGYRPQEIELDGKTQLDVTMQASSESLEQVVVIGYGQQERGSVTSAITSLNPTREQLEQARGVEDYLQGRAAGVYVSSNGFEPGSPTSIKIRGTNSLTGSSQPLYVIDGIIVSSASENVSDPLSGGNSYISPQGGITGLNPRDIESIEILKDASATSIYGSRGSNGVIIITTKQGESGNARFNASVQTRIGKIANNIDVLEPLDYIAYQNEYRAGQGFEPNYYVYAEDGSIASFTNSEEYMLQNSALIPRLVPVDWSEFTYQNSLSTFYRLSISGGSETTRYYLSGGYLKNEGIVPRTYVQQGDINLNLTQDLNEKTKLKTKISATLSENSASKGTENLGGTNNSLIRNVISAAPFFGVQENVVDEFDGDLENALEGPLSWLNDYDDYSSEFRVLARTQLEWEFAEDFKYSLNLGGDYRYKDRSVYYGLNLRRGAQVQGEAGKSELKRFRYNIDNLLEYKTKIGKSHKIDAMVGFIVDNTHIENSSISGYGFALQDLRAEGISSAKNFNIPFYATADELLLSTISRVNYSYKNRYILTMNYRADGSSNFSNGNRWGHFPSFGFAWRADKEKFLRKNEDFTELKFRLGWGLTGNQNISPYSYFARYVNPQTPYADGDSSVSTFYPGNLVNLDLTWEKTSQYNVGVDVGLLEDRISFTVDAYYKNIYDLLLDVPLPGSAAFDSYPANRGDLINKGIEFGINADVIQTEDFNWNFYGTFSHNRNEIGNLNLPITQFGTETGQGFTGRQISGGNYFKTYANIYLKGRPNGLFFGFETDGIINDENELANAPAFRGTPAQLGDVLLVDQNGDGNVTDDDKTIIGDPNPDFNFGFGSTFSYKAFTLNFLFNGVYGQDVANANLQRTDYAETNSGNIRPEAYFDAWRPENPDGAYPRIGYNLAPNTEFTDRIVEDASFIRLNNISLSYNVPIASESFIDNLDLTLSGQNLALWTDYSGFDPEVDSYAGDPLRVGLDRNSFPNQRSVQLGINLGF